MQLDQDPSYRAAARALWSNEQCTTQFLCLKYAKNFPYNENERLTKSSCCNEE